MDAVSAPSVCRELRLRQFRNFEALDLSFPDAGVAVVGDNGAGKSNLLEAIYYLEIFRSFRGANDEQLVRIGEEGFNVRGRFEERQSGAANEIGVGFDRRSRRKRIRLDGTEPERLSQAIGRAAVVIFSPADVSLVSGTPAERRRFLDIVLSLNVAGYLDALQRYRHILRQRNAVLRSGVAGPILESWNEPLVRWGSHLIEERAAWLRRHGKDFTSLYARIAGGGADVRLDYRPSVSGLAAEDRANRDAVPAAFRRELARVAERERSRGMTLAGPHRDLLAILADAGHGGRDLRSIGSGGQQRTAAIALRLVESATIRTTRLRHPVLLLDDLFAELDPGRADRLLAILGEEERGQVILTAPKPSDLEPRGGALVRWHIEDGRIHT